MLLIHTSAPNVDTLKTNGNVGVSFCSTLAPSTLQELAQQRNSTENGSRDRSDGYCFPSSSKTSNQRHTTSSAKSRNSRNTPASASSRAKSCYRKSFRRKPPVQKPTIFYSEVISQLERVTIQFKSCDQISCFCSCIGSGIKYQ